MSPSSRKRAVVGCSAWYSTFSVRCTEFNVHKCSASQSSISLQLLSKIIHIFTPIQSPARVS